jgi:hypothetical protein
MNRDKIAHFLGDFDDMILEAKSQPFVLHRVLCFIRQKNTSGDEIQKVTIAYDSFVVPYDF